MTKVNELREMADEQIRLVWKDAAETLFRLRLQAQTEKLAAPSGPPEPAAARVAASRWKWLIWAAVVAVIALVSRALLRPGSAGRPVP